jgi:hypothetical protein
VVKSITPTPFSWITFHGEQHDHCMIVIPLFIDKRSLLAGDVGGGGDCDGVGLI